ncbi:xanthotoxin 5-hydroxylase CYP82C4-like [Macadamia integrifolia]|uniref:xanthotoxin 5-hydroxylase CYP82C4-like n=1 Tax=Macadamia integrifolia TaxID=60698 RepID=UPI001C4ED017|nr:xanthotoxin 5-hydroxylase CYP82C4-like [Macadamia integrifolia]
MDSLHPQVGATVLAGASLAFILFICNLWRKRQANTNHQAKGRPAAVAPPEAGGAWPIIGHLHLLGGQKHITRTLGAMADKYGPVFMLQLGVHKTLVVSSWELTKDCFTTNDLVFATRPRNTVGKYLGYNYALLPFTPYGPYWRKIRKIATLELLSKTRLEMLKHVIATEVDTFIKQLYNGTHDPVKMEMNQWFNHLNLNVITRMIAGKRYCSVIGDGEDEIEARRFRKAIEQFAYQAGVLDLSDVFPYLEWMDLQGNVKAMKCIAKELDSLMENWMEEHHHKKQKRDSSGEAKSPEGDQLDFIDVMLSIFPEDKPELLGYDRCTIIKATALTFILAGTETTSVAMSWALSLILNNQQVLKKAQEELDVHVGRNRHVNESDIKNLVYLDAIVKETLRLYPPIPLSLPHEAMEDCEVGGYHVPKGTRLIINFRKLHRDPHVWSEPHEFRPERFLTGNDAADIDFKGRHFEYIPFSSGRRVCVGITFATKVMHLTLARLLQGFNLMTPQQMPVDMTEGLALSLPKASPLEVLLTPRLPSKLYE